MGVNRVFKRGQERIEVRKRWPDKTTFRRYYPNMKLANETYFEIEVAIAQGTWQELKRKLQGGELPEGPRTFDDCATLFLEKHAKVRMRSWTRYRLSLEKLGEDLGDLPLAEFHRSHLHAFVKREPDRSSPPPSIGTSPAARRCSRLRWKWGGFNTTPWCVSRCFPHRR